MPFKTKRQKLAAAQRRFSYSDSGSVTYDEQRISGSSRVESRPTSENKPVQAKTKVLEIENLGYVRADLVKILITASIIISSQIALSLV